MLLRLRNRIESKIIRQQERRQHLREQSKLRSLKGKSSKYFTYKTLKEMCDNSYSTIIDYYDNNTINVVRLDYKGEGFARVVVYFDDKGMYNCLNDINTEGKGKKGYRKYSRAYKFHFSTHCLNQYQGFDGLIKEHLKRYRNKQRQLKEELRKYKQENRNKLDMYL